MKEIKPDYLASESNLFKNSKFFRKYFLDYKKDVLVMSFVPQKRFKDVKPFLKRKNKCIATGTFIDFPTSRMDEQVYEFYKINIYQPMRGAIYNNEKFLEGYVDSYIPRQTAEEMSGKNEKAERAVRFLKRLYKLFFVRVKKEYFSFDIVELYNNYRMCVVGEETELPGIGFVEGMACGCAYLGQDLPFYKDIGMVAGKHFIIYNGTVGDLKKKIAYYQKNPRKLQKIAKEGRKFIQEKCNYNYVIEKFLKQL